MSPQALSLRVLESLLEGCQVIDSEFRYAFVNESAARHGRRAPAELLGRTMSEAYPGIEQTDMYQILCLCMADGRARTMENEFVYPDGSSAWFELRFEPVPGGTAILSVDISDRKRAEAALARKTRALSVLSECNQTLVRADDEASFVERVCQIITELGGYPACWIAVVEGGDALRVVSRAGFEVAHSGRGSLVDPADADVPHVAAIRTSAPVVARSLVGDDVAASSRWRRETEALGLQSCLALPVKASEGVIGALTICAREGDAFDDEEQQLLAELALDLGFGIQTLRSLSERARAEARYRDLVENLEDVVISTDARGNIAYLSPAVERCFGYAPERLLGERVANLVVPDDLPGLYRSFERTLAGEVESYEFRIRDAQGEVRHVRARARVRRVDGRIDGVDGVVTDNSELRRAEEAERQILLSHSILLANLPGMAYRCSVGDGWRLELVSDGCVELTGYTRDELLDFQYAELVHEDDRERVGAEVENAIAEDRPFVLQYRIRTASGDTKWVWEKGVAVPRPGAEPVLEGLVTDVTSRIRAEQQAREGKARIRAIFDYLPNPCYVWRQQGARMLLTDFSDAAAAISDDGIAELLGVDAEELPVDIPTLRADLDECLSSKAALRREVECVLPGGGETRRYVVTYGYVPNDTVVMHAEDVTVQHQTAEQLKSSQRLEAIGRLAGGVAHDFNNLLSVILSYSDFAIEGLPSGDPVREDIEEVQKAGQRAAALTRQLLAFSRKQVMEPQILDLNGVVRGIEGMLRRLLGEDIEIRTLLADGLRHVEADPGQLEQVVMNLAVNSRDAMPRGGMLIIETANVEIDEEYASSHVAVGPGDYAMLCITDTGEGMDAETLERVFEPFFTTKEQGRGTGLGLSMVYGIVKQSGGNIWAYSEPAHGTCFKVYLPAVDAPEDGPRRATSPGIARGHETVLVVEDEIAVRRLAERVLQAAGYTVVGASRASDALRLCELHHGAIDLLLTDVIMPHVSGRELASQLLEIRPEMKVVFMSGYTDEAIVRHGVLEPGTSFISKPFTAAALTNKVREALDGDG